MHMLAFAIWVSFLTALTVEGNFMPTTVSLQRKMILRSCHFHLLSLWLKTVQSSAVQPGSEKRALGEI